MSELFTIVSIVIAVSGATYTALLACRNYWRDRVNAACTTSRDYVDTIGNSQLSKLGESAEKTQRWVGRWLCMWKWSFIVPVLAFTLVAFTIAIHVLIVCWEGGASAPPCWSFYRWIILALVALDGVSFIGTFVAYWGINAMTCRLGELSDTAVQAETLLRRKSE